MLEKYLTNEQRGILLMVIGILLLLHTIGIFAASLYYIIVLIAIALIAVGFMKANLYPKVMAIIRRKKGNSK